MRKPRYRIVFRTGLQIAGTHLYYTPDSFGCILRQPDGSAAYFTCIKPTKKDWLDWNESLVKKMVTEC